MNEKNSKLKSNAAIAASRLKALQPATAKLKVDLAPPSHAASLSQEQKFSLNAKQNLVSIDLSQEEEPAFHEEEEESKRRNALVEKNLIGWDDLDAEDSGDPLMVSEYVEEIFCYMRKLEVNAL
jgi:hypothetical protein